MALRMASQVTHLLEVQPKWRPSEDIKVQSKPAYMFIMAWSWLVLPAFEVRICPPTPQPILQILLPLSFPPGKRKFQSGCFVYSFPARTEDKLSRHRIPVVYRLLKHGQMLVSSPSSFAVRQSEMDHVDVRSGAWDEVLKRKGLIVMPDAETGRLASTITWIGRSLMSSRNCTYRECMLVHPRALGRQGYCGPDRRW